jgi:hypothetical protein
MVGRFILVSTDKAANPSNCDGWVEADRGNAGSGPGPQERFEPYNRALGQRAGYKRAREHAPAPTR